ncbi:MAG: TadE/TadG family type IV pilus assembly protein [Oryzihumus sp.]
MTRRSRCATGRSRDRGAVAVEAAIITPVLIAFVFAVLEFGLVFKDSLSVSSAIRGGVRMASAEPRRGTFATDAASQVARGAAALDMSGFEALWVYKAQPDGTPVGGDATFSTCSACVKFTWNGTGFTQTSSTWSALSQNACVGDPLHDSVGVYLAVRHQAITGMFFRSTDIRDHTVMNLEPVPLSAGCK